jgi:hypothetical protein
MLYLSRPYETLTKPPVLDDLSHQLYLGGVTRASVRTGSVTWFPVSAGMTIVTHASPHAIVLTSKRTAANELIDGPIMINLLHPVKIPESR